MVGVRRIHQQLQAVVLLWLCLEGTMGAVAGARVVAQQGQQQQQQQQGKQQQQQQQGVSFLEKEATLMEKNYRWDIGPDRPIWEERNPLFWTIRSIPSTLNYSCALAYLFSYIFSWLTFGMFLGNLSVYGGTGFTEDSKRTRWLGLLAMVASMVSAAVTSECTASPATTQAPCLAKSRKLASFLWPGIIFLLWIDCFSWSPQLADKELEDYVMHKQMQRDKVLQSNKQVGQSEDYSSHRDAVALANKMKQYNQATKNAPPTKRGYSNVLRPVPSPWLLFRVIGLGYLLVVSYLIFTSCDFSSSMVLRGI